MVVGMDGCGGGKWLVAARADRMKAEIVWSLADDVEKAIGTVLRAGAIVVIDIPIGLSNEPRLCDIEARKYVGHKRASSVFRPPCFAALAGASHKEASAINRQHCNGVGLTIQAFGILKRIATVNAMMTAAHEGRVFEGHPEVSFRALAGTPLTYSKHKPEGISERQDLLHRSGVEVDVEAVRRALGRHFVGRDDVIDAAVCLLTASRIRSGEAQLFPFGTVATDAHGRRMAIHA